jgi:hypothetical protein
MDNTYFRVFRSIWTSNDFRGLQSGEARVVMFALLSEVAWANREYTCTVCGKTATVRRGEAWFSMTDLAEKACTTRNVVRTALKRLSRSGFTRRTEWCKHRLVYRLVNFSKFDGSVADPNRPPTDPQQAPNRPPTGEKKDKKDKKDKKTSMSIQDLPGTNPLAPFVAIADRFQRAMAGAKATMRGWKRESAYARHHRQALARALQSVAPALDLPKDRQDKVLQWLVTSEHRWGDDGQWSWLRVMDTHDPGPKWRAKAAAIVDSYERPRKNTDKSHYTDGSQPDGVLPLDKLGKTRAEITAILKKHISEDAFVEKTGFVWMGRGYYATRKECERFVEIINNPPKPVEEDFGF